MVNLPTIKELFDAGAHFGHPKHRLHPKANKFIYATQKNINIIDLKKSLEYIKVGLEYITSETAQNRNFLVVGTKKQLNQSVKEFAEKMNLPFVNHKWLGGALTNFETIKRNIKRMVDLEAAKQSDEYKDYTKKEKAGLDKQLARLIRDLEGLKNLTKTPDNLFIVDVWEERIALAEAKKLGIPIVAITDTNWNPDEIDYIFPVNDDVLASVKIIFDLAEQAIAEGKTQQTQKDDRKN